MSQVDTSYIYNPGMPYGLLDIRLAKSAGDYYYLEDHKTFSFREVNGVKTDTYLDMTAWDSGPYGQGNMREKHGDGDLFVMNYRLLIPQGYDPDYTPGYPLVVLLHGSLERGNCAGSDCYHATSAYSPNANVPPAPVSTTTELLNNDYNLVHGGSNYLDAQQKSGSKLPDDPTLDARAFPGFVLVPQNLNGWDVNAVEDAIRLARLISKKYNIDKNSIYLNGVSHGGHGVFEAMKRAPWLFAAAVVFSAADDASVTEKHLSSAIAGIPIWMFQGGQDTHPTQRETERFIDNLRKAGGSVRYTLYPELGHGTWNKAFAEPDLFSWMLKQKRNNIDLFAANAVICKTTGRGASLSLPEGFAAYQWEYNGTLLDTATHAVLTASIAGAYRARYATRTVASEMEWNGWSASVTVTEKDPSPAVLAQIGTVILKDPNGKNDAVLKVDGAYPHSYWFKDGALLDLPGEEDDTVEFATLNPGYGNGVYTVSVAGYDNCPSPPSRGKYIFFSDSAPVNINTPADLTAQSDSPSKVSLAWGDASDNETGFEIWRRRRIDDQTFGPWEMVALTSANAVSFMDDDLVPSSTYNYMIRAVSNSGRSLYCPDASQPVAVSTSADETPPSAPAGLAALQVGADAVKLSWEASTDNSSIREYLILYDDDTIATRSTDTTFVLKRVEINRLYVFSVRAADRGNNISEASNKADVYTEVNGLFYQHSTGAWESLADIDWSFAEYTGVVNDFTLAVKTQEDFFNFRFDGYLHIRQEGVYQFRISSDDGSRLSLDDSLLVENDGVHNLTTVTGPVQILSAGAHRITVDFFDYIKDDSLLVEYKGPDAQDEWMKIPPDALTSNLTTATAPKDAQEENASVYPNPTTPEQIYIQALPRTPADVTVVNNMGGIVYKQTFNGPEIKDGHIHLQTDGKINTGFYVIVIRQNGQFVCRKIIVE